MRQGVLALPSLVFLFCPFCFVLFVLSFLFVIPQGSAVVLAVAFAVACPFVCHPVGICFCLCLY
jgi:hypothetical protein